MAQQWRVRITGKQHKSVDIDVLVQAVVALGRQLSEENQERIASPELSDEADITQQGEEK